MTNKDFSMIKFSRMLRAVNSQTLEIRDCLTTFTDIQSNMKRLKQNGGKVYLIEAHLNEQTINFNVQMHENSFVFAIQTLNHERIIGKAYEPDALLPAFLLAFEVYRDYLFKTITEFNLC